MPDPGLPPEVIQFIREHISSIEQLEILFLLRESQPRAWHAKELADMMHLSEESVERRLKEFVAKELVRSSEGDAYCFQPKSELHNRLLSQLTTLYKERRVAVITQVFSNPVDHIQTFADAFKLKPKN